MPHIHELNDFTITVIIINKTGKALLVNHPRYGKWIPIGGHIELDEDPEVALYREIKEESGLDVEILTSKPHVISEGTKFLLTPNYMDIHEANPPHKHISLTYFALAESDNYILSDEHDEMKWFTEEELEDSTYVISNAVKFYCKEAIELVRAKL